MDRRDWFGRAARGALGAGGALALPGVPAAGAVSGKGDGFDASIERLGANDAVADRRLLVDVAADAWNGAFVTVRIDASALADVRELHLLREDHVPSPLVRLEITDVLPARLSLPIRLDRPCRLRALALTGSGWVRAAGTVRSVGAPGCG